MLNSACIEIKVKILKSDGKTFPDKAKKVSVTRLFALLKSIDSFLSQYWYPVATNFQSGNTDAGVVCKQHIALKFQKCQSAFERSANHKAAWDKFYKTSFLSLFDLIYFPTSRHFLYSEENKF